MTSQYNAHKGSGERGAGSMTVAQLIAHLETMPASALVVMSHDGTSDHVSPVASLTVTFYQDEPGEWVNSGEGCRGWLNNAPDRDTVRAVCLWPDVRKKGAAS